MIIVIIIISYISFLLEYIVQQRFPVYKVYLVHYSLAEKVDLPIISIRSK